MNTTADKLNKLIATKASIKAAIEAKGVTDVGERFADYPDKILQIPSPEYEVVNLTLTTNQATHDALVGKVVHAKYATEDESYAWHGEAITVKIPKYVSYSIEFPTVEGYRKPGNVSYTAVGGNTRNITVSYDTELLTVTVSCEVASVDLTGQEITINGVAFQTPSDRTIVVKIPFGKAYDIVASARAGFDTPKKLSFTASQASRGVSVIYTKISLGIFILDTDGNLVKRSEWNTSNNSKAVGVAVLSFNCKFVIAPTQSGHSLLWSKNGAYDSVPGVTTSVNSYVVESDYKGVSNSSAIVSKYGAGTNYAAGWCQNFTFRNGKKGYLGSCGEWQEVYNNRHEIGDCLLLIGSALDKTIFWTSTQGDPSNAWTLSLFDGYKRITSKNYGYQARAFAAL